MVNGAGTTGGPLVVFKPRAGTTVRADPEKACDTTLSEAGTT